MAQNCYRQNGLQSPVEQITTDRLSKTICKLSINTTFPMCAIIQYLVLSLCSLLLNSLDIYECLQ